MLNRLLLFTACSGLPGPAEMVSGSVSSPSQTQDPLRIWVGQADSARLDQWVMGHLDAQQRAIRQLLSVQGTPTIANTLAPFDQAMAELGIAGSEAGLIYSV